MQESQAQRTALTEDSPGEEQDLERLLRKVPLSAAQERRYSPEEAASIIERCYQLRTLEQRRKDQDETQKKLEGFRHETQREIGISYERIAEIARAYDLERYLDRAVETFRPRWREVQSAEQSIIQQGVRYYQYTELPHKTYRKLNGRFRAEANAALLVYKESLEERLGPEYEVRVSPMRVPMTEWLQYINPLTLVLVPIGIAESGWTCFEHDLSGKITVVKRHPAPRRMATLHYTMRTRHHPRESAGQREDPRMLRERYCLTGIFSHVLDASFFSEHHQTLLDAAAEVRRSHPHFKIDRVSTDYSEFFEQGTA